MAYGLSNGHVTDDITWLWKVKLVTPIRLERNISNKKAVLPQGNRAMPQVFFSVEVRQQHSLQV